MIVNIRNKKFKFEEKIIISLKLIWIIINIPAYIILMIAFVYDSYEIIVGNVSEITYEFIFSTICILFVCFTINEYYQFGIFTNLIMESNVIVKKIEEEKEKSEIKINETEFEFDLKALPSNLLKSSNNNININKEKIL